MEAIYKGLQYIKIKLWILSLTCNLRLLTTEMTMTYANRKQGPELGHTQTIIGLNQ